MSKDKKTVLKSGDLWVEVNDLGAELSRILDRKTGKEILWSADPAVWNRHAPILFPFVGKCWEKAYTYKGKEYSMPTQHGFARDMEFTKTEENEREVWYELRDTQETFEKYPFHFRLLVGHRVENRTIHVMWKVINEGDETMFFMIGGHPAFLIPEGHSLYDFSLQFDKKDELHYEAPDEAGFEVPKAAGTLALDNGKTDIVPGFFKKALTYMFDEAQVGQVDLLVNGAPYITIQCEGFPYLAVWTMEGTHPFLCLEPWYGRTATKGFSGELQDRAGITAVEGHKTFEAEYTIEVHEYVQEE
ncbi:MAG: aldose 1-epimerase family protein [bacterium]|nr:aldose 1-epimerase family protein [bacterium]